MGMAPNMACITGIGFPFGCTGLTAQKIRRLIVVFDDDVWNAFYRLMEAARDLGHESEVDALCVLYENDASGNDIKASFRGLIKKETLRFNELAA